MIYLRAAIALGLLLGFLQSKDASGLELKPDEIRGKKRPKPVAVLQKRYFKKAFRPEVGIMVGAFLNEAYTSTATLGARVALFPNEWYGIETQFFTTTVSDSQDRKILQKKEFEEVGTDTIVTPDVEVNPVDSIIDLNAVFSPFYGKLNFMDLVIVYTDIYVTAGMSQLATAQGDKTAVLLGAGQRFYLGKALSLRLDFRDRIFDETRGGESTTRHALAVNFGVSWFFF